MSDPSIPPAPQPVLPPIIADNLMTIAKMLLAGLAGWLVHHGLIASTDTAEFIDLGSAIILALGTFGWAWFQHNWGAQKLVAAAATGNPLADPKAPATIAAVAAAINDNNSPIRAKPAA